MAQTKVNGAPLADQFLTGTLDWFIVTDVDAATDIDDFGTVDGNAETVLRAVSTVANPVVVEEGTASIMYVATEVPGVSAASLQTAVAGVLTNATVVAGTVTVV